jgi:sulfofructose kinase
LIQRTLAQCLDMSASLLCVGHVALDLIFGVADFPAHPTKVPSHRHHRGVGGMSANAAVALARLGARVRFCGPVGDDEAAAVFEQHLQREGVDTRGLRRVPGQTSSVSAIIVDRHGERMIFNAKGSALSAPGPFDASVLDGVDWLLTDPRCPLWAEAALREARRRGVSSMLDGDVSPQADLQRLAPLADWVVFSEPGLQAFSEQPAPQALQSLVNAPGSQVRCAVRTLGPGGVQWCRAGQPVQHLNAWPLPAVVDTLGAGDVFHGALGLALAEGQPDEQALRFAAAAAALKCQRPDGIQGAPSRAEVQALMASGPWPATA